MKSVNSHNSVSSNQSTPQQSTIKQLADQINLIIKECQDLLQSFPTFAKNCMSLEQMYDIFEAITYEINVRTTEISTHLTNIVNIDTQNLKNKYTNKKPKVQYQQPKSQSNNLNQELPNIIVNSKYDSNQDISNNSQKSDEDDDSIDQKELYDWILNIDLLKNVSTKGWKIDYTDEFPIQSANKKWEGATVAVLGLYDKGKTFILNQLTQQNLPSGKKVQTQGISFKHVKMDSGTSLILVDTAGSYAPVKILDKMSIIEKELTEQFIQDLVFEISDYFICVVNDFTSLDQRYLDKLARNLNHSVKSFKEIIVIHNLKEIDSPDILYHVWHTQVTQIYQQGSIQRTKVAAINPFTKELEEKHVLWFKTHYTRHVCLVGDGSQLGMSLNQWVISLVKYWLKAVFVPQNRKFAVGEIVLKHCEQKLSSYLRKTINLEIQNGYVIQTKNGKKISQNSNGMIIANREKGNNVDQFVPAVDIINSQKYIILIDLPGVTIDEIELYRQNVITIVRGYRRKIVTDDNEYFIRNERKYGDFEMRFKIPPEYERKWNYIGMENGVLRIQYEKDQDDLPVKCC